MRRIGGLLTALVATWLPFLVANAQPDDGGSLRVRLAAMAGWVDADSPLEVTIAVNNPGATPLSVQVRGSLLRPVTSRLELQASVDDGPAGRSVVARLLSPDARTVRPNGSGRFRLSSDWVSLGRPRLGVYPVHLEAIADGSVVWSTVTAIAVVEGAPSTRLRVVAVLPVSIPHPPVPRDGAYAEDALAELDLASVDASVRSAIGWPVTLAPQGSVLDLIEDLADGALGRNAGGELIDHPVGEGIAATAASIRRSLRDATRTQPPVVTGYAGLDPAWLADLGVPDDARLHLERTETAQRRVIGRSDQSVTHLTGLSRVDPEIVGGVVPEDSTIIVSESALGQRKDEPFSPELFGTSTALSLDDRWQVLVADNRLSVLADQLPGTEAAQAILAEMAIRWLELPLYAPDRLIVFAPSRLPSASLLSALLPRLNDAPWIDAVPPSEVTETQGILEAPAAAPTPFPVSFPELQPARTALATATATIGDSADPIAAARVDAWERALLISERVLTDGQLGDPRLASSLTADLLEYTHAIRPARDRRITLTSRSATVPVVLENGNDLPAIVQVRLSGRRVRFPEGESQTVDLPPGDTTIEVQVEVLGRGEFPIQVELRTTTGTLLARSRMILRSTQVSNVALVIVITGIVFLAIQGLRRRTTRIPSRP